MRRIKYSALILFAISLAAPKAKASPRSIAELLEKYESVEKALWETQNRIKFKAPEPAEMTDMPKNFQFRCSDGRMVSFESTTDKRHGKVNWGLRREVAGGSLSYSVPTPQGSWSTNIKNHIYYEACEMNQVVVSNVHRLACDPRMQATNVIVMSAFRDPLWNKYVGGKSASQHLQCRALDFWLARNTQRQTDQRKYEMISPNTVWKVASDFGSFNGIGRASTFSHLDNRPPPRLFFDY